MKSKTFNAEKIITAARLVSDMLDDRIFDDGAETIDEMVCKNKTFKKTALRLRVKKLRAAGKVEVVWKRVRGRAIPAYRPTK